MSLLVSLTLVYGQRVRVLTTKEFLPIIHLGGNFKLIGVRYYQIITHLSCSLYFNISSGTSLNLEYGDTPNYFPRFQAVQVNVRHLDFVDLIYLTTNAKQKKDNSY
jgi:hypothetical protein